MSQLSFETFGFVPNSLSSLLISLLSHFQTGLNKMPKRNKTKIKLLDLGRSPPCGALSGMGEALSETWGSTVGGMW